MRAPLAALCAALLCIPASVAVGYRLGQDEPDQDPLEEKLHAKTEAFFAAYNGSDAKTLCELVGESYMGWYGPGMCINIYSEPTPPADRLTTRILEVVQVDGNSALVVASVAVGKEKPVVSTLSYELTPLAPAGDYRREEKYVWELKKGKTPKRPYASWQIVGVA